CCQVCASRQMARAAAGAAPPPGMVASVTKGRENVTPRAAASASQEFIRLGPRVLESWVSVMWHRHAPERALAAAPSRVVRRVRLPRGRTRKRRDRLAEKPPRGLL